MVIGAPLEDLYNPFGPNLRRRRSEVGALQGNPAQKLVLDAGWGR
jgi:hypothetical protein